MRRVTLPGGETVPALGQGTWMMGESPGRREAEIAALRRGVELGLTLIDTAEMYGEGASESLIGEALGALRDDLFLVSKVYPHNAGRERLPRSLEASLRRLKTDRLDLYLLHWRGAVPLAETVAAMEAMKQAGKIRYWGVSNLDADDMAELMAAGGSGCAVDQVLYNPGRRGPEFDLLPWLRKRRIPLMAYSPIEQGRLVASEPLRGIADRLGATPAQVALAWCLRDADIIAIPKAGSPAHVEDNRRALDLVLDDEDRRSLDRAFPLPKRKTSLDML